MGSSPRSTEAIFLGIPVTFCFDFYMKSTPVAVDLTDNALSFRINFIFGLCI